MSHFTQMEFVFFKRPVRFNHWFLFYVFCSFIFMFLVIPILVVIPVSFNSSEFLEFPPRGFSLKWYASFFDDPVWMGSMWRSFRIALWVALLSSAIGTLAALSLVRGHYRGKDFVMSLLISPLMVPIIVKAVGFYYYFAQLKLVGTELGLILAHTCTGLPYVVVVVSSTLINFDITLEQASMNLGANRLTTFFRITFPIIRPGILAGALFAFFSSFDDLIIAIFLSGVRAMTLPKKMWDGIRFELSPTITAVASILILISIIALVAIEIARRLRERYKLK